MSDFSIPSAMPVLSRGKHRQPSRGACFMEYTSVLAGEPFTDGPRCVDEELAAVLRGANDKLSDAERPRLVPLLGRAIGLAVEAPPQPEKAWRRPAPERRLLREQKARYNQQTARLRRAVSRRFMAAVGASPSASTDVWSGGGEEVAWLFWDLMTEPTTPGTSEQYVTRLLERLPLLHECYEHAMADLGLPRVLATAAPEGRRPPVTA
jgi:hypothetical protein